MTEFVKDSLERGRSYLQDIPVTPDYGAGYAAFSVDTILMAVLIAVLVIVIALYWGKIGRILSPGFTVTKNQSKTESSGSFRFTLRIITFLFAIPVASVILYFLSRNSEFTPQGWVIVLFLLIPLLIKKMVLEGISWVTSEDYYSHKMEEVTLLSFSFFTLLLIAILPFLLLTDWIDQGFLRLYFLFLPAIYLIFYIILFMLQIFKGKFSLFWGFLYLCTLEILPIGVLVSFMLK